MKNNKILLTEIVKAIHAYQVKKLSLGGLVNRLEELVATLTETGIEWIADIDYFLLQLEIINSLVASGDRPANSLEDVRDVNEYLRLIEIEGLYAVSSGI